MDLLNIRGINLYKTYKNIRYVQLWQKKPKCIVDKFYYFKYCEDVRNANKFTK